MKWGKHPKCSGHKEGRALGAQRAGKLQAGGTVLWEMEIEQQEITERT